MSIYNHVNSGMKLEMKLTFIMTEIKIVCKIGSFIYLLQCTSGKIAEKSESD